MADNRFDYYEKVCKPAYDDMKKEIKEVREDVGWIKNILSDGIIKAVAKFEEYILKDKSAYEDMKFIVYLLQKNGVTGLKQTMQDLKIYKAEKEAKAKRLVENEKTDKNNL